ncbi:MAG: hypothetical protein JOY79_11265 [Acidobacteriaceae bacterium]|nr:hypothetical protein [Acidobacteriaceae bacterium]
MSVVPRSLVLRGLVLVLGLAISAGATDAGVRVSLPKHTKPTPVQQLNRAGVKAVEKHDYSKARRLFYKAYLLDPNDPFTLNNLGYVSELEGDVDRAQRYYALAAEQNSDAVVDQSTNEAAVGKPVAKVAGNAEEEKLQVNRLNVAAIGLLQKDRAGEAEGLLRRALALDPRNPFTLNNLGFAEEKQGEWEKAYAYYYQAATVGSNEPVVVTVNKNWRGKPISEVATRNANTLRQAMRRSASVPDQVARLNLRGVSALNRNDRRQAREYFEQAYKLDPGDAFTLNNMGYVAEMDGDRETANFYYEKAEVARKATSRVDVASRTDAEGRRLGEVARQSGTDVDNRMQADLERKRAQGGPVILRRRDKTPVVDTTPPPVNTSSVASPQNQQSTSGISAAPPAPTSTQDSAPPPQQDNKAEPGAAVDQGPSSNGEATDTTKSPDAATPPMSEKPPAANVPSSSGAPSTTPPPDGAPPTTGTPPTTDPGSNAPPSSTPPDTKAPPPQTTTTPDATPPRP